jgi:hypothetical protein
MNEDLTVWFRPEIKPVRRGWYQRKYLGGPAYCLWNGRYFSMGVFQLADRKFAQSVRSESQDLNWRGLAREPE